VEEVRDLREEEKEGEEEKEEEEDKLWKCLERDLSLMEMKY
jgi:hypothetical protein